MIDVSEETIKKNCPHCDPNSFALKYPLEKYENFWIVYDVHPLIEGHILIISKKHLSCIGAYPENIFQEFLLIYKRFINFLKIQYGSVAVFEHGRLGQTVFHSHIHLFPFKGSSSTIVPEGKDKLKQILNLSELITIYEKDGGYLFFAINSNLFLVDKTLSAPRFFRDRFARVLGRVERCNWKEMRTDKAIMKKATKEIHNLQDKWRKFTK